MFIKSITVSPFASNCYIVASEKTRNGVIIDPGDEVDRIIGEIEDAGVTVSKIINTHGHIDHTAGAKEMQDKLGIPFFIHEGDMDLLKLINEQAQMYGMETRGVPEVEEYLNEGDIIEFDDIKLSVLHTPGHSPGGICFLGEKDILVGDTLFEGSIGRTDLPGGDYEQLIEAIDKKLMTLDEKINVFSGHGSPTTIGVEKRTNPFLVNS
ncbi:MBL fold metallo-hydrolase [candidate division KSB1 bacterium]|nr:MBL fold metallo-hydrolase [candidate division KSB1 bacterium]